MRALRITTVALSLVLSLLSARAQRDTIEVSTLYTTYIRFPIELLTAERSDNENTIGEIVPESKNIIRLRATRPFSRTSNITAIDSKGYLHTYYIKYVEHPTKTYYDKSGYTDQDGSGDAYLDGGSAASVPSPGGAPSDGGPRAVPGGESGTKVTHLRRSDAPTLREVIALPQGVFHLTTRKGRMVLACENIFTYSDMLYVVLRIDNRSGVSYESDGATFTLSTMSRKSKVPLSTTNIYPKNRYGSLTVAPGSSGKLAYSLNKLTLASDQVLQVSVPERNGSREFMMVLTPEDVNLARSPLN